MSRHREADASTFTGWSTETELVREFDASTNVSDAVAVAVTDAINEWPMVSESPPLAEFVEVENLDGLFGHESRNSADWLPSVTFQFQGCRVTALYGSKLRVLIERDP